jgi:hypothetical protein
VPLTTCTRELIYVPLSPDSNSTMRTHTNVYSDTSDKLAIGWGSPQKIRFTRDPSGQHQNGSPFPEASHPPESWSKATSAYIVRRDGMTHVRKPCTIARLLHFIGRCRGQHIPSTPPQEGKRNNQAKQVKTAAPWKSLPGSSHRKTRVHRRPASRRPRRRYFSLASHISCNRT